MAHTFGDTLVDTTRGSFMYEADKSMLHFKCVGICNASRSETWAAFWSPAVELPRATTVLCTWANTIGEMQPFAHAQVETCWNFTAFLVKALKRQNDRRCEVAASRADWWFQHSNPFLRGLSIRIILQDGLSRILQYNTIYNMLKKTTSQTC